MGRFANTYVAYLLILALVSSCGGRNQNTIQVSGPLPHPDYTSGVDPQLMDSLANRLADELARSTGRGTTELVVDYIVPRTNIEGGDTTLTWEYNHTGDYDLNTEVNISDLVPIGVYFGQDHDSADWDRARVADGDGNWAVNINDVTPIGANWQKTLDEYVIEGAMDGSGPWEEIGRVAGNSGVQPPGGGLPQLEFPVPDGVPFSFFRVFGDGKRSAVLLPHEADKLDLWRTGAKLRGVNIWQAVVIPDIYGDDLGPGHVGYPYTQADFDRLASWGCNYVNISHPGLYTVEPPYVLDTEVQANLDNLLEMIEQADMFAVISIRNGPGRSEFTFVRDEVGDWFQSGDLIETFWTDMEAQEAWALMWRHIAGRYKDRRVVAAYDLMVEPNAPEILFGLYDEAGEYYPAYAGAVHDWNRIYPELLDAVRGIDPDTPVIIPANSYSQAAWLPYLTLTTDDRVVYAFHQYAPAEYTHQFGSGQELVYPGAYSKQTLAGIMETVDAFIELSNAPVVVNEWGAMRYAAGAHTYFQDQAGLFDASDVNNAFWAWPSDYESSREWITWNSFNLLHGPDRNNHADVETSSLIEAVKAHWAQNTIRPSNFFVENNN